MNIVKYQLTSVVPTDSNRLNEITELRMFGYATMGLIMLGASLSREIEKLPIFKEIVDIYGGQSLFESASDSLVGTEITRAIGDFLPVINNMYSDNPKIKEKVVVETVSKNIEMNKGRSR